MKVTTRHGDYGLTDVHGKRISKTDLLMEVIGELDTLMAQIILCSAHDETYRADLIQITEDLTTLCSYLAGYHNEKQIRKTIHVFQCIRIHSSLFCHHKTFSFCSTCKCTSKIVVGCSY